MAIIYENEEGWRIDIENIPRWKETRFKVFRPGFTDPYYIRGFRTGDRGLSLDYLPKYSAILDSLLKDIVGFIPGEEKDLEDYGWSNGWEIGSESTRPRMQQETRDREENPSLCVLEETYSIGHCQTLVINWTYGYKYRYDSSD